MLTTASESHSPYLSAELWPQIGFSAALSGPLACENRNAFVMSDEQLRFLKHNLPLNKPNITISESNVSLPFITGRTSAKVVELLQSSYYLLVIKNVNW